MDQKLNKIFMRPIRNNVLLKPFPSEDISEGGIFIPETAREISNRLVVVAVGNGIAGDPMKYKEGDVVYRVKNWGLLVIVNGEQMYMMSQKDILAYEN